MTDLLWHLALGSLLSFYLINLTTISYQPVLETRKPVVRDLTKKLTNGSQCAEGPPPSLSVLSLSRDVQTSRTPSLPC